MPRIRLCCDASTAWESVAVVRDGQVLAEASVERPRGHGPTLLDALEDVLVSAGLRLSEVDAFVCGLGPGSFTGLRVSLATMKGLAMATGRPLYGVRTVESFRYAHPGRPVLAVMDARRGEVFADGHGLDAPLSVTPERLAERLRDLSPLLLVGPGALLYADRLRVALPHAELPADEGVHQVRAAALGLSIEDAAPPDFAMLEPIYVRASDAEINYPDGFPDATVAPKQKLPAKAWRRPLGDPGD